MAILAIRRLNVTKVIVMTALLLALTGCRFGRVVVNEYVKDLDTTWIRPGVTTREEIKSRMGVCPSTKEGGGITQNSFRWVCNDSFTRTFEAGYFVTPTFERGDQHYAEDILILFDERGIVKLLSRTRSRDGVNVEIVEWKEAK